MLGSRCAGRYQPTGILSQGPDHDELAATRGPAQTVDEIEAYWEATVAYCRKLDTPKLSGPRRHHYIPQFYLKLFALKRKRLIRIPIPAPQSPSRKATNTTKLAVMKDFYTTHTAKGESALIENVLAVWDGDASECIKQLADRNGGTDRSYRVVPKGDGPFVGPRIRTKDPALLNRLAYLPPEA